MILLERKLEHRDHHLCQVSPGPYSLDWIHPQGTHFLFGRGLGVELEGSCSIRSEAYCAFSLTRPYRIHQHTECLQVEFRSYLGQTQWAEVSAEKCGRLSYIDGCSNTNVIAPLRNGDPCINYLYLPPGTRQSAHVHPTVRVGMICGGNGAVHFWQNGQRQEMELKEGVKFLLPAFMKHCFHTEGSYLSVLVFHPDSEGGPLDQANPMFTRTYISPSQKDFSGP
jgi:hypothetical protein